MFSHLLPFCVKAWGTALYRALLLHALDAFRSHQPTALATMAARARAVGGPPAAPPSNKGYVDVSPPPAGPPLAEFAAYMIFEVPHELLLDSEVKQHVERRAAKYVEMLTELVALDRSLEMLCAKKLAAAADVVEKVSDKEAVVELVAVHEPAKKSLWCDVPVEDDGALQMAGSTAAGTPATARGLTLLSLDTIDKGLTRKTKCRPNCQRGQARRDRDLERQKERAIAVGFEWVTKEVYKLRKEEESKCIFEPLFVKQASLDQFEMVQKRYVVKVDARAEKCLLCNKHWDEGRHGKNDEHVRRVHETARGDEMLGPCLSCRRFQNTPGCLFLNKQSMRDFWGHSVAAMAQKIWHRVWQESVCFEAKLWPSPTPKRIHAANVLDIRMGSITYSGTGKYATSEDRMVLWDQTPGTVPVFDHAAPVPEPEEQFIDRLIDPVNEPKVISTPPNKGWWPVCWLSWKGEATDNLHDGTESDYRSLQLAGSLRVWIVCWYQLFDGSRFLTLWPTYLMHSRL